MGDFKRLVAWQKAHAYMIAVRAAFNGRRTGAAPGLRAQVLRAVSSIPDNLAEGCGKRSRRALASYADNAYSSAKEVENDLIKSRDLGILPRVCAKISYARVTRWLASVSASLAAHRRASDVPLNA